MIGRKFVQRSLYWVIVLSIYAGTEVTAAQTYMASVGDELALLFCSQVRYNRTNEFRSTLREYRLRIRDVYPRVRCNGETMIQFSHRHQAADIGRLMVENLRAQDLEASQDFAWSQRLTSQDPIRQAIEGRFK